jgi:uncharacterized phage protein (TIGR01671 family)
MDLKKKIQREIRFRVWDKETSTMLYPWDMPDRGHHSFGVWSGSLGYHNLQSGWGTNKIMQYTGLKDKNGKEVFESDIVYWPHMEAYGIVYYNSDEVHYFVKPIRTEDETESYLDSTHMEVIGNIYENPELI